MEKSPDAFRTISEAADELDLPQHVLRFWETRFSAVKPLKRGGGRRYYRPEDVLLLRGIQHLLYDQGFTIKGVQKILKDQGVRHVMALGAGTPLDELPLLAAPHTAEDGSDPSPGDAVAMPAGIEPDDDPDDQGDDDGPRPLFGRKPARKPRAAPADSAGLTSKDRETLNGVLKELLDMKRLLDRLREG